MIESNSIKEIHKGIYHLILDFPERDFIYMILSNSYKYVWGINHIENSLEWSVYKHSLFGISDNLNEIEVRNINLEFLVKTQDFKKLIPKINQKITIIQTNIKPPYYLDLKNLNDASKYQLLKSKIDFLFELEMPSQPDYTPIISSNKAFLEDIIAEFNKYKAT